MGFFRKNAKGSGLFRKSNRPSAPKDLAEAKNRAQLTRNVQAALDRMSAARASGDQAALEAATQEAVEAANRRGENMPEGGDGGDGFTRWFPLISSNVDRIRYNLSALTLEVIFKNGVLYSYYSVEPETFMAFQRAPSPGQFVWYVLRQFGYAYKRGGSGNDVAPPAEPRFDEQVYAVPDDLLEIQRQAGREPLGTGNIADSTREGGLWNKGTPKARGVTPPTAPYGKKSKFPPSAP